jgi:hypothetical protein
MAKQTAKNLPKKQVVELDNCNEIKKSDLVKMVDKYKNLVITKETVKESEKALSEVKQKRYEIQRIIKGNKEILNAGKKVMEANGNSLIELLSDTETYIQKGVDRVNAEKARIKAEKEAEKARLLAERTENINKIQREFSSLLIQASTPEQISEIESKLNAFEVTEEEFGDLKIACETTISGIHLDINIARTRIEDAIEAEKRFVINNAKDEYLIEAKREWTGEDDIELILKETKQIAYDKYLVLLKNKYILLGGNYVEGSDAQELEKLIEAKQKELADFAKQKREEEKAAKKVKEELASKRLDILLAAGIDDLEWAAKIQANDYPEKMIEDLTDVEFDTFKNNLIAILETLITVDFEEVPVESPAVPTPKVEYAEGITAAKKEPIIGEFKPTVVEPIPVIEKEEVIDGEFVENTMQWKIGKHKSTVVSDTKIKNTNFPSPPNAEESKDEEIEYYGGYLICESIGNVKHARLIAAAPGLLAKVKKLLSQIEMNEYIDSGIHKLKNNKDVHELNELVSTLTV